MLNKIKIILLWIGTIVLLFGCASLRTNEEFYYDILNELRSGSFNAAAEQINIAELNGEYADKDRVLLHLDKGIIFHYQDNFTESK